MAGSLTSAISNIQLTDNIGIQCNIVSADAAGTIAVQISADHQQDTEGNVTVAGTWTTITSQVIAAGAPSPIYFDLNQLSAPWLRTIYTRTSGTGTLTILVTGKML